MCDITIATAPSLPTQCTHLSLQKTVQLGHRAPTHTFTRNTRESAFSHWGEAWERSVSPTPAHLRRALYIPFHNNNCTHLPLYDVSKSYAEAVGDVPLGGSEFKTKLCLMKKPSHHSLDVDVRFLVDVEHVKAQASIEERRMGNVTGVTMSLPNDSDRGFLMESTACSRLLLVTTTYPLPNRHERRQTIKYPDFRITMPNRTHTLEWQIYPCTLGKLGYVLVDMSLELHEPNALAIYHHAGIESEMPTDYSDGILLLSDELLQIEDTFIVASLFGLLWSIRTNRTFLKKSKMKRLGENFRAITRGITKLPKT